ncbi:S-formylglutathione hydrolase [Vibrio sp. S4M6]|uniref:S-formylglutathione hydrolase n=1 Tax=Vibrio sinus TaxID=2946865 RepID=UPI002029DC88|nr:S-formylglutathione hydrolase [Vibrio sinus]MCL9782517.1 S-formylglutathione hydrolase [Vibrio sinus]
MTVNEVSQNKVFGGWHKQFSHASSSLKCEMRFAVFLPHNATESHPVPAVYWLSGLTCTDENFMQKAGAFRKASELGIAIIAPDTSPRGELVEDCNDYDLGQGAGFYVNATQKPWSDNYHMYDYVVHELPTLIEKHFPISSVKSIAGHSMGGHGAMMIGLKNPDNYRSISAFSPICHPSEVPWGQKAFTAYLGNNPEAWAEYDSVELLKASRSALPILVDQGDKDCFLTEQLKPDSLIEAAHVHQSEVEVRIQYGYDHSYYFISSYIDEHLQFHSKHLFA